jgi:hypothetical protein
MVSKISSEPPRLELNFGDLPDLSKTSHDGDYTTSQETLVRPLSHDYSEDEKVPVVEADEEPPDVFKPFPLLEGVPAEPNPLTFRAVFTGILLGSLVNASNVYLGKKRHLICSND